MGQRDGDGDHHDHNDELQPEIWTYTVLLASLPLFYMGHFYVGLCFVGIALMYKLFSPQKIPPRDRLEIQYNIWTADEVVEDLLRREAKEQNGTSSQRPSHSHHDDLESVGYRIALLAALPALAKKYNKQHQRKQIIQQQKAQYTSAKSPRNDDDGAVETNELSLLCQKTVYLSLNACSDDNEVAAAAFALLALVAKNEKVRERHMQEADQFGFDVLIRSMDQALDRAKDVDDNNNIPKGREQDAAELQRKGCLMLGALADGDANIALQVVQEGGLKAILDAVSWYRFHERVANWGLWAVFILCYENKANKAALLELNGLAVVLQAIKNCADSVEVARHGIATGFDLLREDDEAGPIPNLDVSKIRDIALSAGLHEIVLKAVQLFSDNPNNMDITMMGRELLVGTGYKGEIPAPPVS